MSDDQDNEQQNDEPEFVLTEWRCSKCDQIGGDSEIGPYAGCPKGGNHDTNGGVV